MRQVVIIAQEEALATMATDGHNVEGSRKVASEGAKAMGASSTIAGNGDFEAKPRNISELGAIGFGKICGRAIDIACNGRLKRGTRMWMAGDASMKVNVQKLSSKGLAPYLSCDRSRKRRRRVREYLPRWEVN